jgi:SH3 domain-containing YSC84-like protein 1
MVIKSNKGMQKLLSSKFEIGRDASVAAGPVGRHSSESTDLKLDTLILTYSRAQGAFVGATFAGALVSADNNSRHAMYGPQGHHSGHAAGSSGGAGCSASVP